MENKKFKMKDEEFTCRNCGEQINKLKYSARNHCPCCLISVHIDINPGDRKNKCCGTLKPIRIEKFKNTFKIIHRCEKCFEIRKNIMAMNDDINQIIRFSTIPV